MNQDQPDQDQPAGGDQPLPSSTDVNLGTDQEPTPAPVEQQEEQEPRGKVGALFAPYDRVLERFIPRTGTHSTKAKAKAAAKAAGVPADQVEIREV